MARAAIGGCPQAVKDVQMPSGKKFTFCEVLNAWTNCTDCGFCTAKGTQRQMAIDTEDDGAEP